MGAYVNCRTCFPSIGEGFYNPLLSQPQEWFGERKQRLCDFGVAEVLNVEFLCIGLAKPSET